jgi:ABC-2 type transport system permease protein
MLFINEWRFCLRQPLVILCMLLMPIFSVVLSGGAQEGSDNLGSQLQLSHIILLMMVLPIVLGVLSPIVFLRDTSSNMSELINCTPITHNKRWLLRYGTMVSLLFTLFVVCFALVLALYTVGFGFSAEFFTITILNLLLLVLPSILFVTAFSLWLSTYWQSAMVMYVWIAILGMIYLMLGSMAGSPVLAGSAVISDSFYNTMLWLDPYGISALLDNINSANTYMSIELLTNRLIYLLLTVALVYVALTRKPKEKVDKKRADSLNTEKVAKPITTKASTKTNTKDKRAIRLPSSPFIQLIKVSFFTLLQSRITQIILLIWPMIIFNEVMSGLSNTEAMSVISLNSVDALNLVAFDLFSVLGAFVIALWSWFICSRDKSYNIAELIAAAPISNRQLVGAHIIALGLMVVLLLLLTFVGSSVAEFISGSEWLFHHYLVQLSLSGLPLFLLGTLFVCLHHLCRSSAVSGGIVALIILIKFTPIMTALGVTHTLWNIAGSPLQEPDNFWGYSASISLYLPYMAVWVAACISLVLLAISRSHRGTGLGKLSFMSLPKSILISFSVTLLVGLSLHFALVDEKPLTNSDKREAWKAQYETSFAHWQHKAQPAVVHIDSEIDIFPSQEFANFKVSYTLENRTTTPIEQVLIGRYGNYTFGDINLDGATLVEFDDELNQGIYQFSKKLMPSEQRVMHAEFSYKQSQYWPHRSHQVVKSEFAYFRANPLLPTVGYQAEYQLDNAKIRANYKLKEIENVVPSELYSQINKEEINKIGVYKWASLSTVISTKEGHHAISQGELVSRWNEGKRIFYKFETKQPIHAIPTWLSVPYAPLSQKTQGTTLNVYFPQKNEAAQVHIKAMADTLTWFAENITPYTGAQLNLVAGPDIGSSGYALPQIILIKHTVGFRARPSSDASFDPRYRRAVNETAHQWFGHGIGNDVSGDRSFLSNSMTKYIELVIIEKHYGKEAMLTLVEIEQERYDLSQRNKLQSSVALIDAIQDHDIHSRATLAFAKLRETVGDKHITAALKSLWLQHAYPKTPATSMDFVRALKRHSAVRHHPLINELLLSKEKT